jgi:hypothetical protein
MDAGVMVLDLQDRVMDVNPAFLKIVMMHDKKFPDMRVEDICRNVPELILMCKNGTITQ